MPMDDVNTVCPGGRRWMKVRQHNDSSCRMQQSAKSCHLDFNKIKYMIENHFSVFAFVIAVVVIALFQKLAALLLRRTRLSWRHSFIFGTIIAVVKTAYYLASNWLVIEFGQGVSFIFALFIAAIIGGWFFRHRATKISGEYIGWSGAIQLAVLGFLLMMLVALFTGFLRFP